MSFVTLYSIVAMESMCCNSKQHYNVIITMVLKYFIQNGYTILINLKTWCFVLQFIMTEWTVYIMCCSSHWETGAND